MCKCDCANVIVISRSRQSYIHTSCYVEERRADIKRLMQSTVPLSPIQNLYAELVKIYDTNNVKLTCEMAHICT